MPTLPSISSAVPNALRRAAATRLHAAGRRHRAPRSARRRAGTRRCPAPGCRRRASSATRRPGPQPMSKTRRPHQSARPVHVVGTRLPTLHVQEAVVRFDRAPPAPRPGSLVEVQRRDDAGRVGRATDQPAARRQRGHGSSIGRSVHIAERSATGPPAGPARAAGRAG